MVGVITSKWGIALITLLVAMVVLYLFGEKSVHHEIIIEASPDRVWQVLTDGDRYPEWNPVMELKEGTIDEGNEVTYGFTQDAENSYDIKSRVKELRAGKLLNQGGGTPFILTFDHRYILDQAENGTRLTIHEEYRGIGVPFWDPTPVEAAYGRLNHSIRERCESTVK